MTTRHLSIALFSVGMLCCVQSLHAKLFRPAKDCTLTIHSEEYDTDTLIFSSDQVVRYANGKEVYDLFITRDAGGRPDSTLIQTTYNERGEKTRVHSRSVVNDQCETTDPPCPVINICITDFSDAFMVTRTWIINGQNTDTAFDTLFFYPNRLARSQVFYENELFVSRTDYEYKFDEDGRISEIKTVDTSEGSSRTEIERNTYRGEDTLPLYFMGFDGRDSSNLRVYRWTYNNKLQMTERRLWENGKLSEFLYVNYTDDGSMKETVVYTGDSIVRSEHYYWWTNVPGKSEQWMSQEYTNSSESNGSFYTCYDTVTTRGRMIVKTYNARYAGNPSSRIAPPLSECRFGNSVYDKQGRIVSQKIYTNYGGKLERSITFHYSR